LVCSIKKKIKFNYAALIYSVNIINSYFFNALTLLIGLQEWHPTCKQFCTTTNPHRLFFRPFGVPVEPGVICGNIDQLSKSEK